jgi:GT2 family glycosyltransferase
MKFAGFIMTFCRKEIAIQSILKIFEQSVKPEELLIIDNDPEMSASLISSSLSHLPLSYIPMGYNAGPSGAAKKGLELLLAKGYDFVAWYDDDDPPYFEDVHEVLLKVLHDNPNCGCTGVVGQLFDRRKGLMKRVDDRQLEGDGYIEVDNIAGNMIKIINAALIRQHAITPEEKLFFGFEELDLDLQIKKYGYSLLVEKSIYRRHRALHKRVGIKLKKNVFKSDRQLKRDYYSTRNMLYLLKREHLFKAMLFTLARVIAKSIISFRYGLKYGLISIKYQSLALLHFVFSIYGKKV